MAEDDPTVPPKPPAEVVDFEPRRMMRDAKQVGEWFRDNPDRMFPTNAELDALEGPAREAAEGIRAQYPLGSGLDEGRLAIERSAIGNYDRLTVQQELERYRTSPELFSPERAYALAMRMFQPPAEEMPSV